MLLKDIDHKNIIKYYSSWVDREKEQIIFITEIMSHGSLKECVFLSFVAIVIVMSREFTNTAIFDGIQ